MIWLILFGCCFGILIGNYKELCELQGQNGFYQTEETMTGDQLAAFWENAPEQTRRSIQELVFFRQEEQIEVKNEHLNRAVKGTLVEAAGNMNLIVPGRLLYGSFASNEDSSGCVISTKTAVALFGSQNPVGEFVCIKGKRYTIRGIVTLQTPLCMIQGENSVLYSHVRVKAKGVPLSVVKQMLGGILQQEDMWIFESDLYIGIGRFLCCLPLWGLFFWGAGRCKMRWKHLKVVRDVVFPVLVFAGIFGLVLLSVHFSDDYVPTAWSDFSFWTALWEEKRQAFAELLKHPLLEADLWMLEKLAGVFGGVVGIFGSFWFYTKRFSSFIIEKK